MSQFNFMLSAWQRIARWFGGKWIFSKLVCLKAPYFASIQPNFTALRPGYCEIHIKKQRAVLNHIGTMHAIAMCNMAELAAGSMTEVTIPTTHRWIPKGMAVEYLKKAETGLRAIAELQPVPSFEGAANLPVTVNVLDTEDNIVLRAVITMWVSPKNR